MTNTDKANQHYVPKFYLRYFSFEGNHKEIGLFNRSRNLFLRRAKLKTQASKKYFYGQDGKAEEWLGKIEDLVAPLLAQCSSLEILPRPRTQEHFNILFFLILLDIRNPITFDRRRAAVNSIRDRLIHLSKNYPASPVIEAVNKVSQNGINLFEMVPTARDCTIICMDLQFKLIKNCTHTPFITSDFPLVKYNQFLEAKKWNNSGRTGFGAIGLQMFFPINDRYMLVFYDQSIYKLGQKEKRIVSINDDSSVDELNVLQYLNCSQNIYFNECASQEYIEELEMHAKKFGKAHQHTTKIHRYPESKFREQQELILVNSSDITTGLKVRKLTFTNKVSRIRLDKRRAVALRPKAKPVIDFLEKNRERERSL